MFSLLYVFYVHRAKTLSKILCNVEILQGHAQTFWRVVAQTEKNEIIFSVQTNEMIIWQMIISF